MNRSIESLLRFVHLTSSGLLAGSLAFGGSALFPGWEEELPSERKFEAERTLKAFNAIGPTALATAVTLLVGSRRGRGGRLLDAAAAASLAGVLGATLLGTVPINRKISLERPPDYPSEESLSSARNWARVHALRTTLGVAAFILSAGSTVIGKRD